MSTVDTKLENAQIALVALKKEVMSAEQFPKGEDFRGTLDSIMLAAQLLIEGATSIKKNGDDDYRISQALVLLELACADSRIKPR